MSFTEEERETAINELEDELNAVATVLDPDAPFVASSERSWSMREMLQEMKDRAPMGNSFIETYLVGKRELERRG